MASLNFPANPADGDYYEGFSYDGTIGVWKRVGGSGAASMTVSETPPTQGLTSGAMWLDSTTGNTYIYYEDADNSQWVQSAGTGLQASRGSDFTVQTTAPANPVDGDIWYDPTEGFTYIYYEDQDSGQWVQFGLNRNGAPGIDGADGADGADGVGIPVGGTTGQTLVKSSDLDYAVEWGAAAGGGAGDFLEATSDSITLDFSDTNSLIKRAVAGDVTIAASGYTAGASKKIYFAGDTVKRTLSFPVGWKFTNTLPPTHVGSSDTNILQLDCFGTTESDIVAQWIGPYAFEPMVAVGGTETTAQVNGVTYKVHTFNTSGTFEVQEVNDLNSVEYLVVAGGAGGGGRIGGGGGAGGMLVGSTQLTPSIYNVVVGAGGSGGSPDVNGSNGSNSSALGLTATGGGGGGGTDGKNGSAGGSGGGGGRYGSPAVGGAGVTGQGNAGGTASASGASPDRSGGGGGKASAGESGPSSGNGGAGEATSISGAITTYAGGGGGSVYGSGTGGTGGAGGGGNGATGDTRGTDGQTNTGGGGGGGGYPNNLSGQSGGSGIVIIRYPITDPN